MCLTLMQLHKILHEAKIRQITETIDFKMHTFAVVDKKYIY